jgi:hypothetical protein
LFSVDAVNAVVSRSIGCRQLPSNLLEYHANLDKRSTRTDIQHNNIDQYIGVLLLGRANAESLIFKSAWACGGAFFRVLHDRGIA